MRKPAAFLALATAALPRRARRPRLHEHPRDEGRLGRRLDDDHVRRRQPRALRRALPSRRPASTASARCARSSSGTPARRSAGSRRPPQRTRSSGTSTSTRSRSARRPSAAARSSPGPSGIIDYGSLMWIALERAKTAREAIDVMTKLVGRVRLRLDGRVDLHRRPERGLGPRDHRQGGEAEGGRLGRREAPRRDDLRPTRTSRASGSSRWNDPKNVLFSKDVVSFAREKGWFTGKDEDFSFADAYAPLRGGHAPRAATAASGASSAARRRR